MARRTSILVALVLAAAAGTALVSWVWTARFYSVRHAPVDGRSIVAFGDSLVVGAGATAGSDLVSRLSAGIQRPIINAGRAGDTTASALERLPAMLAQHHPDLVIVLLGGNDALQRLPPEETLANLKRIITAIQAQGGAVLLLGVRGGVIGDPYRRGFAKLARETRAAYVPNVLDSVWGNSYLMADEIHPNDIGYGVIAERVQPVLEQLVAATEPR